MTVSEKTSSKPLLTVEPYPCLRTGKLVLGKVEGSAPNGSLLWRFYCDCGETGLLKSTKIREGQQSCGCLRGEQLLTHGHSRRGRRTPENRAYNHAKARCENSKDAGYSYYGGRGIRFRFPSFVDFLEHIGTRPSPLHSLDRIDNNGHYEVGNVRWATKKMQANNRRSCVN